MPSTGSKSNKEASTLSNRAYLIFKKENPKNVNTKEIKIKNK